MSVPADKRGGSENAPDHKGHRDRLKAKYRRAGLEALHDYEAVELMLCYAIPQGDVKPSARALLKAFGSIRGILDADRADLEKVVGIGPHSATLMKIGRAHV